MTKVSQIVCPICRKTNLPQAKFCQYCGQDVVLNNDTPSDDRRYLITRVIKQGGQGAVYEGVDQDNSIFAIKEMLDTFTDPKERDEAIARFNTEAELLQGMAHPRIPRVYSHFTDEGRHYLTMEFIRGEDLEQMVEQHGALPEATVLEWADQICDVLSYLHSKGLIYRDMKPSNVMIENANGAVKLVDFGITKLFKPTERGTQIGTPGYAPPEQYQGMATPVSDIYALGATLHHLLTGRDPTDQPPFSFPPARDVNINVSRRTSDALEQALKMQPEDRYGSVAEFRAMLRPLPSAQPTQVRVAPATAALPRPVAPALPPRRPTAPVPAAPRPVPQPAAPVYSQARPAQPAQPARRQRQGGGFFRAVRRLFMIVLALVLIVGGLFVAANAGLLPTLGDIIPQQAEPDTNNNGPLTTQRYTASDIEVQVAANADDAAILAAFRDTFAQTAKAALGERTTINTGTVSVVGGWEQVAVEGDQATYRADVVGFVQAP